MVRIFVVLLTVFALAGIPVSTAAQDDLSPESPVEIEAPEARAIREALESGRVVEAWNRVLETDRQSENRWEQYSELIDRAVRDLNSALKEAYDQERWQRVLELGGLLAREESANLVQKAYPQFYSQYQETVRRYLGMAYWRLGEKDSVRGNLQSAESYYRQALSHLKPGDQAYARVANNLATVLYDRGARANNLGETERARQILQEAVRYFNESRVNAGNDPEIGRNSAAMLQVINQTGLIEDVPGLPTPTPAPTPTPEGIDAFFSEGFPAQVKDFFQGFTEGQDTQSQILFWGGIIVGFILIYWVIPLFLLGRLERRGDIIAANWHHKGKFLGIFALFGFMFSSFMQSRARKTSRKEHGCPHCGEALDDILAYEDLVFSRCPHCKNKIVPMYSVESYIEFLAKSMATDVEKVNMGVISLDSYVKQDAVARLVRGLVTLGVRRRASDLHVEPDEDGLVIRQRIDGLMTEMCHLPRSLSMTIVSAIKVSADMDISEKRRPQDGKFQMQIDKTPIDVRVASSPTAAGEKVSMRILDIRSIQMGTKHLGMSPPAQEMFERAIHQPHGMILITGPTGSGKTTTIYVALQRLTTGDKNIISIEDPIEFRIPGVNQTQINAAAGLTFAGGLRSILRQDPDVIVVGEIRDKETAEISVNSVQTGHLVFSTLHTVDAASSVARLIDFEVSPRQFADALSLIVAQRLIRLVCQYCKKPDRPDESDLRELNIISKASEFDFQKGAGCETCNQTGYYRRTGIFEMLQPSERMRVELENATLSTGQIREIAMQGGMSTLRQEAIDLLREGRTSVEETLRITK